MTQKLCWTPSERAAELGWKFAQGLVTTPTEVARAYGLTYSGARRLLINISAAVPLTTDEDGRWTAVRVDDAT